ncbi:MAG TPA: EamA family transporter [Patescibacteria group bacterium]|nr:EamA family transporter [Patescibacteria group bacterium]
MSAVYLAFLAAIAFGFWTIFHKYASPHIDQVFGAILVSLTAVILGAVILLPQLKNKQLVSNPKGILFVVLAGICAFFIDFLALSAYAKGLPISVGGPIIIGGSIAIASIIGIFLGESVGFLKILALFLIILGSAILAKYE